MGTQVSARDLPIFEPNSCWQPYTPGWAGRQDELAPDLSSGPVPAPAQQCHSGSRSSGSGGACSPWQPSYK